MHLGLHCSRKSFSATILDPQTSETLFQTSVDFDSDLPHRETTDGFCSIDSTQEYFLDPQMLVESLDTLLEDISNNSTIDLSSIATISGCSAPAVVFLQCSVAEIVLNPNIALIDQIRPHYSHRHSPIARDNSANNAANTIKDNYFSSENIRSVTGIPITSHTGAAQIRKIYEQSRDKWLQTRQIHTAGSFLCSILIGKDAPLDQTDSSQLCLYNIHTKAWQVDLVETVTPDLLHKLPSVCEPASLAGNISEYFQLKYGFSPDTKCLAWLSEDATYCLGVGNIGSGDANIRLDDTYSFQLSTKSVPSDIPASAKVTIHPIYGYLSHTTLENGSGSFNSIKEDKSIDDERIAFELEAIPSIKDDPSLPFLKKEEALRIPKADLSQASLLSFVTGQFLHIKLYSQWTEQYPDTLILTGENAQIAPKRLLCANVFQISAIHRNDKNAYNTGACILADVYNDVSIRRIKEKYYLETFQDTTRPEPFMTSIYNHQLSVYHQLLTNHITDNT